MKIRFKYLTEDRDRHGNVRLYFRRNGKKIRVRSTPGSDEFLAEYASVLADSPDQPRQADELKQGSFRALCIKYYASPKFHKYDQSTKAWQRRALDRICKDHGAQPVAMLTSKHVRKLRDELIATPAAAKHRLKALRSLFSWAVEEEEVDSNPTIGVKAIEYKSDGHHTWTIEEVERYEQRHPIGTQARLAMGLLLYTSWRREDAVRLGPQHIQNGRILYRQAKNEDRSPVDMDIPVHDDLAAIISATPSRHLTFLVTAYGRPFSKNGFGNKFKDWCRQADLPHCSAHGLRKAAAARLAERGATVHEIMAITGIQTLEVLEVYTRRAQRAKLADSAMAKLR